MTAETFGWWQPGHGPVLLSVVESLESMDQSINASVAPDGRSIKAQLVDRSINLTCHFGFIDNQFVILRSLVDETWSAMEDVKITVSHADGTIIAAPLQVKLTPTVSCQILALVTR